MQCQLKAQFQYENEMLRAWKQVLQASVCVY